jgi:hypothetical protein
LLPSENSKYVVAISEPLEELFSNSKIAGVQSSNLLGVIFGTIRIGNTISVHSVVVGEPHNSDNSTQ